MGSGSTCKFEIYIHIWGLLLADSFSALSDGCVGAFPRQSPNEDTPRYESSSSIAKGVEGVQNR